MDDLGTRSGNLVSSTPIPAAARQQDRVTSSKDQLVEIEAVAAVLDA
jgi:hypothetical protein